ncbi:MAG: zinc ribbon domain-containing protein [Clostridia bacterium]|nr:zinc ribbon domain-containing protein [Clostridia bacterium]
MKKLLMLLIIVVILFTALSLPAAAADYTIDDFSMQLSLPDDYAVFTRNMMGNEPVLKMFNLSLEEVNLALNEADFYLLAYDKEQTHSIYIKCKEDIDTQAFFNLNLLSEYELDKLIEDYQNDFQQQQLNLSLANTGLYRTDSVTYIFNDVLNHGGEEDRYLLNYGTYYNGRYFDFWLVSYEGEVTEDLRQIMREMIDSVAFTVTLDKPNPQAFTNQYNIEALDLQLNLNETYEVTLADGTNDGLYLTASSTDDTKSIIKLEAWENEQSRQIFSFANLPNEELDKLAEEYITIQSSQTTNRIYDGYKLFNASNTNFISFWYYEMQADGQYIGGQIFYTIYNGRVLAATGVDLNGYLSWAHSQMLVEMVKSFDLPAAQKAPQGSLAAQYEKGNIWPAVLIIIGILAAVGVYLAVYKKRQAQAAAAPAPVANNLDKVESKPAELQEQEQKQKAAAVDDNPRVQQAKYCYKCGTALMEGAVFCHSCGTKINKGESDA